MPDMSPGASPCVLALRDELRRGSMKAIGTFEIEGHTVIVALGHDSLWAIGRGDTARIAVRTAYSPGGLKARRVKPRTGEAMRVNLTSVVAANDR